MLLYYKKKKNLAFLFLNHTIYLLTHSRFAEKKMKRFIVLLIFLLLLPATRLKAEEKERRMKRESLISIGVASPFIRGQAGMTFSHGFAENWSAEIGLSINLKNRFETNEEQTEHNSTINRNVDTDRTKDMQTTYLSIQYWPSHRFKGGYLSLGGRLSYNNGGDITLGCGYMIRIWKGLGCCLEFKTGLFESIDRLNVSGSDLELKLTYKF